jgi:hypothetical protein
VKSIKIPKELPMCLINNYRPLVHTLESYTFDVKEMIEEQRRGEMTKERLFSTLKGVYKDITIAERHYKNAMAFVNKGLVKPPENIGKDNFLSACQEIVSANAFTRRKIREILKKVYKTKLNSILNEYNRIPYEEEIIDPEKIGFQQKISSIIRDIYDLAGIEVKENMMDYYYNPIINLEPLFDSEK